MKCETEQVGVYTMEGDVKDDGNTNDHNEERETETNNDASADPVGPARKPEKNPRPPTSFSRIKPPNSSDDP